MKYILILFASLAFLNSCSYFDPTIAGPPTMRWMYEGPNEDTEKNKDVNPLYLKGWKDGCHTGVSANANQYYKTFYDFVQDSSLAQNPVYYKGWKDAFNYCGRYIYQYQRIIGL
ncbi:MAG: hypothetical protein SFT90_05475 [Rickettsiales bacterium]|nr:hypothetical protein [Rickettsiales bacterium]